jgi:hypothetical protein
MIPIAIGTPTAQMLGHYQDNHTAGSSPEVCNYNWSSAIFSSFIDPLNVADMPIIF